MTVGKAFDQSVAYYDNWMKVAVPGYEAIFSAALELIPFDTGDSIHVLDLGAGTGLFSQLVFEKYPQARFVLTDLAPKMLNVARTRFQQHPDRFEIVVTDYRNFQTSRRFDLIISSLSIHHLEVEEKKKLFRDVFSLLNDRGIFINVDQVKGPSPDLEKLYWDNWLKKIRAAGATEGQIEASIKRRKEFDRDTLLVDQLAWLSEAGFASVDCIHKHFFVGVMFASKGSRQPAG